MSMNRGNLLKKYFRNYYVPFMILFVLTLLIASRVTIHPGDDEIFRDSFVNNGGIIGWFKNYTAIWSGRVIPHFILIVLLNTNLIFWGIINSFMFVVLAIGIFLLVVKKSDSDKNKTFIAWVICALIFFIPTAVLSSAGVWVTGSVTYLWPMAFAFLAILPFKRLLTQEENSKILIIISILSGIYASYSEQSAAVMIAFNIFIIIYSLIRKIKVKWYHYFSYIVILINSIYSLTVAGNAVRSQAEKLRFYCDFDMLSVIDKIFLGLKVTFNQLFNSGNVFLLFLSILIMLLVERKQCDYITKLMAVVPLVYSSLKFIGFEDLYKFSNVNPLYVGGINQYLSYIAAMICCLIIIYLFYIIFDQEDCILISLMFLAAISCSLVMGFSPTVYASGSRIFFATNVLLIICIGSLFKKYLEMYKINKILYISVLVTSLLLAIRFIIFIAPNLIL